MTRRAWLAGWLSFAVYLLPLVGPHALATLGELLLRGDRPPAWRAAEIAVALGLQLAAGAVWYWMLVRPRSLRPLALALVAPVLFATAQWVYLVALPGRFLVESDREDEVRTWSVACTAADRSLAGVGRPPATVRRNAPVFVQDATGRLGRLTLAPGDAGPTTCAVSPLDLPPATANDAPAWIGSRGSALLTSIDRQTGAMSWRWLSGPGAAPLPIVPPAGRGAHDAGPVVSRDGDAIAWLVPLADSAPRRTFAVVVRPLAQPNVARDEIAIPLAPLGAGSFTLLEVDVEARELLLAIDERPFVAMGFDGAIRWGPTVTPVQPLSNTFRRVGNGWVAWDASKDDDTYSIAWSLPPGSGTHRVLKDAGSPRRPCIPTDG
ncbi:MAG: hypothetical protein HYR51_11570 [Candidatus Rokubacteria bacterium]|nr:hypothetical protein [Candidatus Rokubacteria bacterium]